MKKITGMLALALAIGQAAIAQKLSIENVRTVSLRSTGAIKTREEVKGYFTLYQGDKIDKNTNEYALQIMDENLNKVKEVKFTDSRKVQLLESAYNGTDLIFKFFDEEQKLIDYRVYGFDGKKKFNYQREVDKKTKRYMEQLDAYLRNGAENKSIFSVGDRGYISVIPVRDEGDFTYEVSYYGSEKKRSWTFNPDGEDSKTAQAQYLGSTDSVAVFSVMKKSNRYTTKSSSFLMGLYLHNGKIAFDFETDKDKYNFLPMNTSPIAGTTNFLVMGQYCDKEDNISKGKSLGLGMWLVNSQGKILNAKYNSWGSEIGKHLNVNAKGRVEDIGYIYFHKILQTEDGNFFAVGEGYKRQADAIGIAANVLAGGGAASTTKIKVTDMMMLCFDQQFNIKAATIYDKTPTNVALLRGMDFANLPTVAMWVKYFFNGFDYAFTQTDNSHSTFTVGYIDFVKEKDYKGGTFNAITYHNGQFTRDKINLVKKGSKLSVYEAKLGSIMIAEYFKKEKRFEMRLEKIN
ncbi:DUF6770 family protein [Pseudoflavitalea rhizosphaerae]|uniref:DUF6770 family protein n=1 Tax=Pseudoflavitalea rhizosphaerae TaxID=1884793 RepID=UPI000F8EF902|nr:DUF6770 family protein [Pseudoflavitalea rhizosphaerae]